MHPRRVMYWWIEWTIQSFCFLPIIQMFFYLSIPEIHQWFCSAVFSCRKFEKNFTYCKCVELSPVSLVLRCREWCEMTEYQLPHLVLHGSGGSGISLSETCPIPWKCCVAQRSAWIMLKKHSNNIHEFVMLEKGFLMAYVHLPLKAIMCSAPHAIVFIQQGCSLYFSSVDTLKNVQNILFLLCRKTSYFYKGHK